MGRGVRYGSSTRVHPCGPDALTLVPRWLRVLQIPLGVSKYMDTLSRSSKYEHAVASHPGKRRQVLLCGYVKVFKVHLDLHMSVLEESRRLSR